MKVTVTKKVPMQTLKITTEFIKLESAMKLSNSVYSGGEAKAVIQEGLVKVNGEVCTMRGKKLYNGDIFSFQGANFCIAYDPA